MTYVYMLMSYAYTIISANSKGERELNEFNLCTAYTSLKIKNN